MMIQEEQILKEKVGQRNCFKVPEGYFDQLSASVMDCLPQQEQRRGRPFCVSCSTQQRVSSLLY